MSDKDSNGIVGGWTQLIPEASFKDEVDYFGPETPVENIGPEDDGIESVAEAPGLCGKVTCSGTVPEPGDWAAPPDRVESGERPHGDPAPPEAPVESVGPGHDGKESPSETPRLSEEVEGPVAEEQRGDGGVPAEEALSEEGLQVCQETATEGSAPSSPTVLSPSPSSHVPLISDQESHAPVGLYTDVTSPCSDTEGLIPVSSTPDIYTHASSAPELIAADGPAHKLSTHTSSAPEVITDDGPAHEPSAHTSPAPESLAPIIPTSDVYTDVAPEPVGPAPDADADISPALEPPVRDSQCPASVPSTSATESQEVEEPQKEEEVSEPAKILADVVHQEDFRGDSGPEAPSSEASEGDGLRRRHVPPPAPAEPLWRAREEEEEEEEEFHLIEKKEEGGWMSLNKCIVGALVLLCLGSIIFTGYFLDLDGEEDSAQPKDPELHGKQEWLNPDAKLPNPQEVSQLLGKLAEVNQQGAILQAQLQEELDLVLQKEPPTGQTENHTAVHGGLWEEQKQAVVEEGDIGQEEEKMAGGPGNGVREEERRTERVEDPAWREGERKRQWMGRVREVRRDGHQEKEWKKGREEGKEWRQREERKEKRVGEGDWKHGKDGGKDKRREWKEKVERRRAWETGREWHKGGEKKSEGAWKGKTERKEQRRDGWRGDKKEGKDWKKEKEWWKAQRGWRGMVKEKSGKEKLWPQEKKKTRALDQADYWQRQRERLWKHRPPVACEGVAECARKEGLAPVQQAEFGALLGSYLARLGGDHAGERRDAVVSLVGEFFADGVFRHRRVPFHEFAEDVADVLEDLVEGDRGAKEEMEEFEREALRRFALAGGGEGEGRRRG
ncbi:pre-B-cell leukemia transcription factor-interacting protein 1-like isoform X2 [Conger conger]|uniref:pre-B-cell leukemia transcription factor-interacting protein 1-like isoform X2 n=1 Tax=Conger conger TaxID=82655 RepID=UPI002A5AF231|nr:pre-B-cell leukemia transcription factor-interacting protein 1-like isoform X2 [Conger conger]